MPWNKGCDADAGKSERLLLLQALTAAASFALSDIIAQKINGGPFNVKRNLAALVRLRASNEIALLQSPMRSHSCNLHALTSA